MQLEYPTVDPHGWTAERSRGGLRCAEKEFEQWVYNIDDAFNVFHPQNHLIKEASEAEWNELEHVTIRLSQGARDYVAGYMAVKVSTESEWGSERW